MFKAIFLCAVLRGVIDHLTGRPNLEVRLAVIEAARELRVSRSLVVDLVEIVKVMRHWGAV